jgi:hypothetical protein
MDYNLSDTQKRELTEFLCECWHEFNGTSWVCQKCFNAHKHTDQNRTFTTPTDAHDLAKKLVKMGEWIKFCKYIEQYYPVSPSTLSAFLFAEPEGPARFCWLAARWMEEKA